MAALHPLSGTSLKDSGEGKSSQWAELRAVHLVVTLLGGKNGQMYVYIWIHGLWPMVWLEGLGLGKNMIGRLAKKTFGEEVCG